MSKLSLLTFPGDAKDGEEHSSRMRPTGSRVRFADPGDNAPESGKRVSVVRFNVSTPPVVRVYAPFYFNGLVWPGAAPMA